MNKKRSMKIEILKSRLGITVIGMALIIVLAVSMLLLGGNGQEEITYRETTVQYGDLTVGVTESGSVDIGTVDQVFELDMSALQRNTGSGSTQGSSAQGESQGGYGGQSSAGGAAGSMGGNMTGGLEMFDQIFGMASGRNYASSGEDSKLTVSEVCVSVGQQVKEGDPLYLLEEESIEDLEEQLQSNVEKAKADLEAVYADQILSGQTAQYTYENSSAYGDYGDTEYAATVASLQEAVADAEKALEKAEKNLAEYQAQLEETTADYEAALEVYHNCEWSCDNTDKWSDVYNYVTYFQMTQTAKATAESLEQKKEQLEKNIEQAEQNVETCTKELSTAKRNLAKGLLTAEETLQLRRLAYSTAQETLDIALAYLEEDAREQEEIYLQAQEKWEEYSAHIKDNAVCAAYSGVITSVGLEEGDSIRTNDTLITLYHMEEVSVTVKVEEADMADIREGTQANISFTSYPETVFQAEVTYVSDASADSSGTVTYEVTATLQGDVSGLFQGMTGEITFITKETRQVLYVSNRAVIREGGKSYVKCRDEDGNVRRQEITTGFSDGNNVEIVDGLSEGDVVLIESKVSL